MKWKRPNDDTLTASHAGLRMQINYMRSHWAWIVTDKKDFPIGGSFLSGKFADTEKEAVWLCELCASDYHDDPVKHLDTLDAKTSEKFSINLEVNGIRAILVSMILYEHTQKGSYKSDEIQTDKEENAELNKLAKSILDQWGEFNKNFAKK